MGWEPAAGEACLLVVSGVHDGATCLIPPRGMILGRGSSASPRFPWEKDELPEELRLDDPWVSRRHAQIFEQGGSWWLTDLRSRNRVYIDGTVLSEGRTMELGDGAVIRLGETVLVFRRGQARSEQRAMGDRELRRRFGNLSTGWPVAEKVLGDAGVPGFPGRAPAAREVRRRIAQLRLGLGHVLVLGETGTGKERVARALGDPDRPFVPQNCAELTRELARSELFGHVRGAFSGALSAKSGLVESAERGVLFLDEIGELTMDVQAELLRFLEDGSYRPVGSTELRRSNARVVAATNADLDAAVRAGRFRLDLLARLRASHSPLVLPPLRERREDIPDWAGYFFHEVQAERAGGADDGDARELRDAPATLSSGPRNAGTVECLLLYPWPGNLRELRGVMRGLAAGGMDLTVRPELLPRELREHRRSLRSTPPEESAASGPPPCPATSAGAPGEGERGTAKGSTAPALASPEERPRPASRSWTRQELDAALAECAGSVRATAQRLGIDRRTLYRLCERLGVDLEQHRGAGKDEPGGPTDAATDAATDRATDG